MKIIMHNSVSVDGSVKDFDVNMGLHYSIVHNYKPDIFLVGSKTAKLGMVLFMEEIPKEEKSDFEKPEKEGIYWAVPDSQGILEGLLHVLRRSEYCKDVVIFTTKMTPEGYINYLKERNYDYFIVGEEKVDLEKALEILGEKYDAETIHVDGGGELNSVLVEKGLVDEISLLVSPAIVGSKCVNLFRNFKKIKVKLVKSKVLEKDYVWMVYLVLIGEGSSRRR